MQFLVKDLAERAIAYGIPGVIVDGTDPARFMTLPTKLASERGGEGPTLIEAKMMRMKGHAIHERAVTYRGLIEYWQRPNPSHASSILVDKKRWLTSEDNQK